MRKLVQALVAIEAHLREISGCMVYLCHLAEKVSQIEEERAKKENYDEL